MSCESHSHKNHGVRLRGTQEGHRGRGNYDIIAATFIKETKKMRQTR